MSASGGLDERSDRADVVDVRVAAELFFVVPADGAGPVVPFEDRLTGFGPTFTTRLVPTAHPVRMARTGERLREPHPAILKTTERYIGKESAWISSDRRTAHLAFLFDFPTSPAQVVYSRDSGSHSPAFVLDAGSAIQPRLLRRVIFEFTTADPAVGNLFPSFQCGLFSLAYESLWRRQSLEQYFLTESE